MTPGDGDLLVVEDEPFLRKAVAASLRFLGFRVTGAENGTDALRLARSRPFDLLILDVMLPGIDGFEIVRRLRGAGNQVPVIFLTAKDARDDKVTGLTIGGDGRLIELSPTEFKLLRYFMLNPGRVLTRAQLLSHVWAYGFGGSGTVVSTYVTYLRRKLASDGPDLIRTQRAVGYCLRLPRPGEEASPDESQASSDEA